MIKLYYCEDKKILKNNINYDNNFKTIEYNKNILAEVNTTDFFNPVSNYLVSISEFDLNEIKYLNGAVLKNVNLFILVPKKLTMKQKEVLIQNGLSYEEIIIDTSSLNSYVRDHILNNEILIEESAIIYLLDIFSNDLNSLINELNKLDAYTAKNMITKQTVNDICCRSDEYNIFELVNLFLKSENEKAFELYDTLFRNGTNEVAIIETMYSQLRVILQVELMRNNHTAGIASTLGINEYRVKMNIKLLNSIRKLQLYKLLNNIAACEYGVKSGKLKLENIKFHIVVD